MEKTWILVANSSEARLFDRTRNGLELVEQFIHPDSRRKDQELTSDHASHHETRTDGTAGQRVYGSFPEPTDPQRFEFDRFARQLATALDQHRTRNAFKRLLLIAPPQFLGMLNGHLPRETERLVSVRVDKDYTKVPDHELLSRVEPYLSES
jgi:protein required for attachment to host cells